MELQKQEYDKIIEYIDLAKKNSNYEFECIHTQRISSQIFQTIMKNLDHNESFLLDKTVNRESLDLIIHNENYRFTLHNQDDIDIYCKENILQNYTLCKKELIDNIAAINLPAYNIYFKMKSEIDINDAEKRMEIAKMYNRSLKYFRYKKRFSYLHVSKVFRVDLTVVKKSSQLSESLSLSGALSQLEHYEIEIEFLNNEHSEKLDNDKCVEILFDCIDILLELIENSNFIIKNDEKESVLNEYLLLVTSISSHNMKYILQNPRQYFLSYQPVTLEKHNLMESALDNLSIFDNYTVTEKTDGERYLLYVNSIGKMYTIDTRLNVRFTGLTSKYTNSICDGEFVKYSKFNTLINRFMCFDIYFANGVDVRDLPLVGDKSRVTEIEKFISNTPKSEFFAIFAKNFYFDKNNIFNVIKKVFDYDKYEYHIDGLIFTPHSLAVGTMYKGEKTLRNSFGGTWIKLLKWKPPKENSIDFIVKFYNPVFIPNIGKCVNVELLVAQQTNADTIMNPYKIINNQYRESKGYQPKVFDTVYLPIDVNTSLPICENKEKIYNNSCIEFIYDVDKKTWIPYRVRHDKTELYMRSNTILNTANSYITASNVWRTIQFPVTTEHIFGENEIQISPDEQKDVYYARDKSRGQLLSKPMIVFHNHIKSLLFGLFKNQKVKCIDLACGKAGDLNKWIDNKFEYVVGFDFSLDNLINTFDGAYKRLYNYQKKQNIQMSQNIVFLHKDLSKLWKIKPSESTAEFNELYKIVWGNIEKKNINHKKVLPFYGIMNHKFNVVSCQFAIHYFFQNDETLQNFVDNVDNVIAQNGYFVATFMNGSKIKNILNNSPSREIKGVINDNTVWMIKNPSNDPLHSGTNQTISVYIETINKIYNEYLVDIDLLTSLFEQKNILPLKESELANFNISSSIMSFDQYYTSKFNFDPILQKFSFMNDTLIFKKN